MGHVSSIIVGLVSGEHVLVIQHSVTAQHLLKILLLEIVAPTKIIKADDEVERVTAFNQHECRQHQDVEALRQ